MNKLLVVGTTLALGVSACAANAQTSSAQTEISTAHAHALMAQSATSVAMAHTHLHHVINCLVGPGGNGFEAAAGNPCKGQGKGAMTDASSDHALHAKLESALGDAQAGLKSESLAAVQQDAGKAAAGLQDASTAKAGSSSW
ncbi:MAG TPA: hypothetical protein VHA71_03240 [Rhodanobacteraceae bacterium]|jgi:hypothetical protein|nr:hypothetical protein [Rhodanobacteraceae bacterium]